MFYTCILTNLSGVFNANLKDKDLPVEYTSSYTFCIIIIISM